MRTKGSRETPSIQSLGRGLTILEAVAEASEPVPLKHLTAILRIDPSSVFRLANTLKRRRFLASPSGRKHYILGPSVWRLSRKYGQNMLATFCREHLRALSNKTGETAHLAIREGRHALFIDHCTPTNRVVTVLGQTGELVPLHCSAHGKALLADSTLAELTAVFGDTPLPIHTQRTISSVSELAKVCAQIRAQGFAVDDGEDSEELRCVAAPIRDQEGVIVASIGISAPTSRFPTTRFDATARQVSATARKVSAFLRS
jgi:IclR family acetate operon transcriptional repressor